MEFKLEDFVRAPTVELVHKCTVEQLLSVAEHFKITVTKQAKKAVIKNEILQGLVQEGVFPASVLPKEQRLSSSGAAPEDAVRLKELELELGRLALRESELRLEQLKVEKDAEIRIREMELSRPRGSSDLDFDVSKNIRLVPQFNEKDVDKYFTLFERVATTLNWPRNVWSLLLQCTLSGKAQEAFAALSVEDSLDFEKVKSAVLRVYELVPEAYRQKFRRLRKQYNQTNVEFMREKEILFDRWCSSQKVNDFAQLKQLILMEEFKNSLPEKVTTYLNEQKEMDVSKAAVLVDEYMLTHKANFERPFGFNKFDKINGNGKEFVKSFPSPVESVENPTPSVQNKSNVSEQKSNDNIMCFYCKKRGHISSGCPVLKKKNTKSVALIKTQERGNHHLSEKNCEYADFKPFVMDGFVALTGSTKKIPVKILRDTAASQSFILEGVLTLNDDTAVGSEVPVRGFNMQDIGVPLHRIVIHSDLWSGDAIVGVRPGFPISGVSVIMGNDLAGGKVLVTPEVTPVPVLRTGPDELAGKFPEVFTSCAVTRAAAKRGLVDSTEDIDLSDSFLSFSNIDDMPESNEEQGESKQDIPDLGTLSMSREQLIADQKSDKTLAYLFNDVANDLSQPMSTGYFLRDGLLMRKWTPLSVSPVEEWSVVTQIVVPSSYRVEILKLAHDSPLAGHLGIRKTYDRILRNFFWPGLKRDVVRHCNSCHWCQVSGKPNQTIPPAPLYPIPAVGEPFERVLVDCVGPLPRTKAGNKFLVTVMCASTRFPEVFPVRKITTPVVVKALTRFFSVYGLPLVLQTDQGSNFKSRIFAQVLKQLDIKHCCSSAYHPESQGALERFHQTLKSMLRTYCLEFEKDWDDGVHLQMFAVREVVQESLGFSPSELVFAHTVRGPLKLLKDKWLCAEPEQNLLDYVSDFRLKLRRAGEIARENLNVAQARMKSVFDKHAKVREFEPGDKVLVLLPIPGSSLQARYSGPYLIEKKVGNRDYMVATPDRRRRSRLCHVNMLKAYVERAPVVPKESAVSGHGDVTTPEPRVSLAADVQEELSSAEMDSDSFSAALTQGKFSNSLALENLPLLLSHLDFSQQTDVINLIQSHRSLFADIPTQTHVLSHDIDVGDAKPIKQHPYRVNPDKRCRLKAQVEYMVKHGIAVKSSSAWSSPCLLSVKANGEDRFCTDFRRVNGVTRPDCYPLPRMEDCVDHVGAARFVSKLDLLKGFWQIPLTDRAQEISAFVTPDNFLQYTVMAFGMCNAPATFQRLMNAVLSGLSFCEAYLDDLVICSSSWTEHVDHLSSVFVRLSEASLTVNLSKCEFGQATVTYLGKRVGGGEVRPLQAKVEAILAVPVPKTRTELRRYLAMVGYYRGFCENFSAVASPLTDLLSPKVDFRWSPLCQSAFEQTKSLLVNAPVLSAPRFDVPFKLAVDACDTGVGAVLLQDGADGVEHPVSYYSKKLDKHQKWYSTIEKEALALVLALEHFEVYVGGSGVPTLVFTDHNPLVFLDRMRNKNRRLMNWSLRLQSFNISISHIRGKDNVVADALSRL